MTVTQTNLAGFYVSFFNRAPDSAGLAYWVDKLDKEALSLEDISKNWTSEQAEGLAKYPVSLTNTDFITQIYQAAFGRAPDAEGLAYWQDQLTNKSVGRDVFWAAVINGAKANASAQGVLDAATLTNKATAGVAFADKGLNDLTLAAQVAAAVNSNPDSLAAVQAVIKLVPATASDVTPDLITLLSKTFDSIINLNVKAPGEVGDLATYLTAVANQASGTTDLNTLLTSVSATVTKAVTDSAALDNPATLAGEAVSAATPSTGGGGVPAIPSFTLTTGADTFVGGSSADVFNALSINADGADASTLTGFDSIDGGAGNDTLNIYSNGTGKENASLPVSATVKNIETINVYNQGTGGVFSATGLDASKFVGATAINQLGVDAAAVTNLAAGTVAGFNGTTQATIGVSAAAAAATANVALNNIAEATALEVAAAAGVLNSVTVSGTRVDATPATPIADLALKVTAGKDVESISINTSINSKLTVGNEAGSAKALSTVDASASTGNIDLDTVALPSSVATVKTGSGADKVGLATSLNTTVKAASVSTGAGNDTINVEAFVGTAAAGQTVTVDAGEGNDVIQLDLVAGIGYNVAAGAGDDTVVIAGTVKTTDKIDGGAGTDTVSLSNSGTLVADDYIVFNKVLTNFETLELTGGAATMDASQLGAGYTTIDLANGSIITKVGAQALIAHGTLTATTAGTDVTANPKVYAGTLNITDKATGDIIANADKVALTVDASAANASVTLKGDAQSASVSLVQALNVAKTDYVGDAQFILNNTATDANLASLTLSGNGTANVINNFGTKLVSVDASGLNSVTFDGKAAAGLTYTSANSAAETIKLGAGIDHVGLAGSFYGNADVVTGLNLVASAADAKEIDVTNSDTLIVAGITSTSNIIKFTTTQTDLSLALKDAVAFSAGNSGADLVFQQGGNTYVFHDAGGSSGAGNGLIDGADTVVQLTGQVNLDLLSSALLHNVA